MTLVGLLFRLVDGTSALRNRYGVHDSPPLRRSTVRTVRGVTVSAIVVLAAWALGVAAPARPALAARRVAVAGSVPERGPLASRYYDAYGPSRLGVGFTLRGSRNRRRITLSGSSVEMFVRCARGPDAAGGPLLLTARSTSAAVSASGAFRMAVAVASDIPSRATAPLVLSGRFLSPWRAHGRYSFAGSFRNGDRDCHADVAWHATARRLNDVFVGRTNGGAPVRFDRTVGRGSKMIAFVVGQVRDSCGDRVSVRVAAIGAVLQHRFHGTGYQGEDPSLTVSGRFLTAQTATGTIRELDTMNPSCGYATGFTAHSLRRQIAS